MLINEATKARFESKVNHNGPVPAHCPELGACHVWTACLDANGYGKMLIGSRKDGSRKNELAHRLSFFLAHGRWPEPECCHHCDNPACVRLSHLFEGTHDDNMRDMDRKNRRAPMPCCRGEDSSSAKLTAQQVRDIRANYALCRVTQRELGERYGVTREAVGRIVRGDNWAHLQQSTES